ncbi:MAG: class I SAM-dependent methyltransferase [Candidatus Acidiferrum sp.]
MNHEPPAVENIRETIRREWQEAAPLWKKWYMKLAIQSRAATELVLQGADLAPNLKVLDLACGSGEPALSVATSVEPDGHVVATDMVPEMLQAARENAESNGQSNIEFKVADAERLPFREREFDRITCRFGFMFFPDAQKSLSEQRRVLKPGGRISYVVWGRAEENPLFSVMLGPFLKHVSVPQPPPDAPGVFRYADQRKLADTIRAGGFRDVQTQKVTVKWPWPGPPQEAWEATREIAAPFKKMIAALPPEKTDQVIAEVIEGITRYYDGKNVNFPATLIAAQAIA